MNFASIIISALVITVLSPEKNNYEMLSHHEMQNISVWPIDRVIDLGGGCTIHLIGDMGFNVLTQKVTFSGTISIRGCDGEYHVENINGPATGGGDWNEDEASIDNFEISSENSELNSELQTDVIKLALKANFEEYIRTTYY